MWNNLCGPWNHQVVPRAVRLKLVSLTGLHNRLPWSDIRQGQLFLAALIATTADRIATGYQNTANVARRASHACLCIASAKMIAAQCVFASFDRSVQRPEGRSEIRRPRPLLNYARQDSNL
jgi:hypothetical protein